MNAKQFISTRNRGRFGRPLWRSSSLFNVLAIVALFLPPLYAADTVPLNSGPAKPSQRTTDEFLAEMRNASRESQHGLANFSRLLTQAERASLAKIGIHVLENYQENTYWVRVKNTANLIEAQALNLGLNLIKLHDEDKVNPEIWKENFQSFRVRRQGLEPLNYVLNADGTLNLTVMFHTDITEIQAKKILQKFTHTLKRKSDVVWIVVIPVSLVRTLAAEEFVRWIDAGPLPFLPNNDHTRDGLKIDSVQQPDPTTGIISTGWTGGWPGGITIGIFDSGIKESHLDFGNRVIITRSEESEHGTQIAATVAGSGQLSDQPNSVGSGISGTPRQWRGMAPRSQLLDISSYDGDSEGTYRNLIVTPPGPGMQLSNHSYDVSLDGFYNPSDWLRDGLIRGTVPGSPPLSRRLQVLSAGNQGLPCTSSPSGFCSALPFQTGYFSLTKQLKNALVVGNWNYCGLDSSKRNQIYDESSLGPAHDGRIKPDVVAPGTEVLSATLYTSSNPPYYGAISGTSSAAAAVSGSLAVLLQAYANIYHVSNLNAIDRPFPSTLRAVMIHTARDITGNDPAALPPCGSPSPSPSPWFTNADGPVMPRPGPDFVTGWGLVNVEKAKEIVAGQYLYEDNLTTPCEVKTYHFSVGNTISAIRVTLAWDDPPFSGDPTTNITAPRLVNDLDLVLIDPNGQLHYSWKLDQAVDIPDNLQTCSTPITIDRRFKPTLNPMRSNDTVPMSGPDVPTGGGVPFAVRGRDHLNNVEVVDVDPPVIAGVWQAKVIGFRVPEPQSFSLVGYHFHDATIPPPTNCKVHHFICEGLSPILFCAQNTEACKLRTVYRFDPSPGRITVVFDSPNEKAVIRMSTLCKMGVLCRPCAAEKSCLRYEIRLEDMATPLQVEVYTYEGEPLKSNTSNELTKIISFNARPGEDYLLVLSPAKDTRLGTEYPVALRITD